MNIPKAGERLFGYLCSLSDVTCNSSSDEDVHGWDFFIQFPRQSISNLPLDLHPHAEQCFVQIKTNSGEKRGVTLKLSNALEAASTDMPFFIVLFVYDTATEPTQIYLLHFWEAEIARTLETIRKLDAAGESDLHNHDITFNPRDMIEVTQDELLNRIRGKISNAGGRYGDAKWQIRSRVGFEDVVITGHFTFKNGVTLDELIDLHIGCIDATDVVDFSARSIRFGIPAKAPFHTVDAARLSIRTYPRPCNLVLSSERTGHEVSIASQIYAPAIPNLPAERLRIRVTNAHVDLVVGQGAVRTSLNTHWNGVDQVDLDKLYSILILIHLCSAGEISFRVIVDGIELAKGLGSTEPFYLSPAIVELENFVKFLLNNTKDHDRPQDLKLSMVELLDRLEYVTAFNTLVSKPVGTGTMQIEWLDEIYDGPAKMIYPVLVELPSHSIYCIVRRQLVLGASQEGTASFEMTALDYARVRIVSASGASVRDAIRQEIDAIGITIGDIVLKLAEPAHSWGEIGMEPDEEA